MHVQDLSRARQTRGRWSCNMKTTSLIVLLLAGAALGASPALAKTSLTNGKQICEAAAKAQTPAPKAVRINLDDTRVSDATLIYTVKVRAADDTYATLYCRVDRKTDAAKLSPAG